jgi:integrase
MRRHSTGGVRKQRRSWVGLWYENGIKKSRVLGLCKEMTKGDAREIVAKTIGEIRTKEAAGEGLKFGAFVEAVFFPFYSRKWKRSTRGNQINRISVHFVRVFKDRDLDSFKRDELQDLLDRKAGKSSYSLVNHLRWDLKQIFDMAVAEGYIRLNPALLLFTPREAKKPVRKVLSIAEAAVVFRTLEWRERLVAKLALLGGMRPGEIFALRWQRVEETFAEVKERVYDGVLDTPKTDHSVRKAALPEFLAAELQQYRMATGGRQEAFVFPSERGTPLCKRNVWNRNMEPKLKTIGLEWCTFQVMRRSHSTLMKVIKADPKLVADQMVHTLDVNQNVYTQSAVELRLPLVNELEKLIQ